MALDERNAAGAIHVEGLREMQLALRAFPGLVAREFSKDMAAAVEPARRSIESRMASDIPHMQSGSSWIDARTGVSLMAVYVVPRERGSSKKARKRPNFAELAMSRAYEPSQAEAAVGLVIAAEAAVTKAAKVVSS